jgi:hypothetical protein
MTWVKDALRGAEGSAARAAEQQVQAEAEEAAYNAEDCSPEAIQKFIDRFLGPVNQVIADLREAGFTVTESGLTSLYLDDAEGKKDIQSLLKMYTSAELGCEYRGMTDYQVTVINLTGMQWNICHPDGGRLCLMRLFPRASDKKTHFASVEVTIPGSDFTKVLTQDDDLGIFQYMLQVALQRQIEKYAVNKSLLPQNRQRK